MEATATRVRPVQRPPTTGAVSALLAVAAIGQPFAPERTPATFPGDDRKRVERNYLQFAGVGVQYAATILVLTLAGIWLDDRVGSAPLFTVAFLLLGFVGATWSLVRQVLGPTKPGKKE
jgi:F0F1-type ATP synthase assembly protein I